MGREYRGGWGKTTGRRLSPRRHRLYLSPVNWRTILLLPNLLSVARVPLALLFALAQTSAQRVLILGTASATDLLDGWLARRTGHTTRWGALIDPIADKTFVLVAFTTFVARGDLTLRELGTILARDIGTLAGALVAWFMPGLDVTDFKARMPGKVVTVLQLATLLVLCVEPRWQHPMVVAVGLASVIAIADYTLALALRLPRRS